MADPDELADTRIPDAPGAGLQGLRGDERVLAILLGGSLASGEADEESDIDLTVVVGDDIADQFTREWALWLRRIGSPVLAGPGPIAEPRYVSHAKRGSS